MKGTFLLSCLMFITVKGDEEKVFYLAHDGKALNLTSSYQMRRGTEHQCLTECLYKLNCEALNVEEIRKNEKYICYLFVVDKCSIPDYKRHIVDAVNFKFYRTRQKTDCMSLRDAGVYKSGIYPIWPDGIKKVNAYCDMETSLGGWTVVMRRIDGQQLFNKSWVEYKDGFGSLTGSFWFGNENMHFLTQHCMYEAKMEHVTENDDIIEANYLQFRVDSEREMYKLHLQEFYSPELSPDVYVLFNHNRKFSTYDNDNDEHIDSCSELNGYGGFWFAACHNGYMTGVYMDFFPKGNTYMAFRIKRSSIKIRRVNNLSQDKPALQSSFLAEAQKGNDGNVWNWFLTGLDNNAWWEVDLEDVFFVSGIRIINKFDNRWPFKTFEVTAKIAESDFPILCYDKSYASLPPIVIEFTCVQKTFARYIRVVQIEVLTAMNLHEVQVFGELK